MSFPSPLAGLIKKGGSKDMMEGREGARREKGMMLLMVDVS